MKKRKLWASILAGFLALIMVLSLIIGVLPGVANAASKSQLQQQIAEAKAEKEKIDKEIADLREQLSDNRGSMEQIVAQKNLIDQEIFMIYQQITNLNEQISTYNLLIAEKQAQLDEAEAHLAELNAKNKERIRAMEEDGAMSYWSVLFKANDFADLLDRLNMVEEIAAADRRRLKEMSDAAKLIADTKAVLETEKQGMEQTKLELDKSQQDLEARRAEADKLLAELIATGAEYEALLADADYKAAMLNDEISDAEAEIKRIEHEQWLSTSKPATSIPSVPPSASNNSVKVEGVTWVKPCNYVLLTSPFGYRTHPVYGDWRFHYGVDLAGPMGTPIVATRAGTVVTATYDSSAGYYVTIDHQDGFSSKYLHMTHYVVAPGDYVNAGQVIGYMGSTGTSTGSHLHFSILYNGTHMNPMDYIG